MLWYLDRKLADVVGLQSGMMETRLGREMEKNKSLLYKAQGKMKASRAGMPEVPAFKGAEGARQEEYGHRNVEDELSPEQLQMFEKENQDMVRHYEETLNQVKYVAPSAPPLLITANRFAELQRSLWLRSRSYKLSL